MLQSVFCFLQILKLIALFLSGKVEVGVPSSDRLFLQIGKKGGQGVKILDRERIIFVIMALGATGGCSQPDNAKVAHSIRLINRKVFRGLGASLLSGLQQAVIAGSDLLPIGGFRNQITGEVLDHELIIRQVFIEGFNDIVPVSGDFHEIVAVVSDGVGVTDQIQPMHRHSFAKPRVDQKPVYEFLIGFGGWVLEKTLRFPRSGGHSHQIKVNPAQQGHGVAFLGEGKGFVQEFPGKETVNGVVRIRLYVFCGHLRVVDG